MKNVSEKAKEKLDGANKKIGRETDASVPYFAGRLPQDLRTRSECSVLLPGKGSGQDFDKTSRAHNPWKGKRHL